MRTLKSNPLLRILNGYLVDSSQPANLSYMWNFGSLLGFSLLIQIITGVTLAMHYTPTVAEAFNSVEHIMRDVNNGWILRYLHANVASAFFLLVYLHISRSLFFGSYSTPRTLVWTIGTFILILMMAIAFLGYVLPYGQMSLWGATVITNLMSAIPWLGQDIVEFIWGGFSVNNATLNRFFALHYLLPFALSAFVIMHLITLHEKAGSGNPAGIGGNLNRTPFTPYYTSKDLVTIVIYMLFVSIIVHFTPNALGESDNYIMANPMQTPAAIVPEWYLLPFYAILRSIPNKLYGVIAMFSAILVLLILPFADISRIKGNSFKFLAKFAYFLFIVTFLILMLLGGKHVEFPYIEFGQIFTLFYFMYFLVFIPIISYLESSLFEKVASNISILFNLNYSFFNIIKLYYNKFKLFLSELLKYFYNYLIINLVIFYQDFNALVLRLKKLNWKDFIVLFIGLTVLICYIRYLSESIILDCMPNINSESIFENMKLMPDPSLLRGTRATSQPISSSGYVSIPTYDREVIRLANKYQQILEITEVRAGNIRSSIESKKERLANLNSLGTLTRAERHTKINLLKRISDLEELLIRVDNVGGEAGYMLNKLNENNALMTGSQFRPANVPYLS